MWESILDFSKRVFYGLQHYRGCIKIDRKSDMHPLNWHRQLSSGYLYYFYADGNKLLYGKAVVRGSGMDLVVCEERKLEAADPHSFLYKIDEDHDYKGEYGMGGDWWKKPRIQDDD
jgi:hypothetical protein